MYARRYIVLRICVIYSLLYDEIIVVCWFFFFFKQKTAYEMRISDWSSDVCSSDLGSRTASEAERLAGNHPPRYCGSGGAEPITKGPWRGHFDRRRREIGRASCRERVCQYV